MPVMGFARPRRRRTSATSSCLGPAGHKGLQESVHAFERLEEEIELLFRLLI